MRTKVKISAPIAESIALTSEIRNPDVPMFDRKTNRLFGTKSIYLTAQGLISVNIRPNAINPTTTAHLYTFPESFYTTPEYITLMHSNQINPAIPSN